MVLLTYFSFLIQMMSAIKLNNLSKSFNVKLISPGIKGALQSFFHAKKQKLKVIPNLSLDIKLGEKVALIGPNGAGKSTIIKMLTGILHPDEGQIEVLGLVPWKSRKLLGQKIGTIFGQRTQLWYNLPPIESFKVISEIYKVPDDLYQSRLNEYIDVFQLESIISKPVRQLSLGERIKCEIIASLLHKPQILFLDEPTIGLDVNAKKIIRDILNKLSKEQRLTLLLTSHDTADIIQVCDRVIIIDNGQILLDASMNEIKKMFFQKKIMKIALDDTKKHYEMSFLKFPGVKILKQSNELVFEVDLNKISLIAIFQEILKISALENITIEDPSSEHTSGG